MYTYTFLNDAEIYKFKENVSERDEAPLCLGNVSKDTDMPLIFELIFWTFINISWSCTL